MAEIENRGEQLESWKERFHKVQVYGGERAVAQDLLVEDVPRIVHETLRDRTPEEVAADQELLDSLSQ